MDVDVNLSIVENIERLERLAREYRKQADDLRRIFKLPRPMPPGQVDPNSLFTQGAVIPRNGSEVTLKARPTISESIVDVLVHQGIPMKQTEIRNALQSRGIGTHRKNLLTGVYNELTRKPDIFKKFEDGRWGLTTWERAAKESA
jgi:hypothetical protein